MRLGGQRDVDGARPAAPRRRLPAGEVRAQRMPLTGKCEPDERSLCPLALSAPPHLGWRDRLTAAGIHLALSLAIAALAAILVFLVWYPGPFRELAGGRGLFVLLISVDVVLGPLLTLAVFDRKKSRRHLRLDLAMIGVLQLAALVYGMHTVFIVRPVAMVFEVDRMRLVVADDVAIDELPRALPAYRSLPLTGPMLLGTPSAARRRRAQRCLVPGLGGQGRRVSGRRSGSPTRSRSPGPRAIAADRSPRSRITRARRRNPAADAAMKAEPATSRFLPAMARTAWVAVLDGGGNVLGYLPFDGFF